MAISLTHLPRDCGLCVRISPHKYSQETWKLFVWNFYSFFSDWTKPQQRSWQCLFLNWLKVMFGCQECIVPWYLVLLCENTTSSRLVEGGYSQYLVTARIFEHIEPILGACSSESQVGWRLQVITSHHHIASSCNTIFVTQSLSIIINTISHHIASSSGPCGIPENTGIPGLSSNTDTGIFENKIPVFFGIFV